MSSHLSFRLVASLSWNRFSAGTGENLRSHGEDIVALRGGVQVIPKEIRVGVVRVEALGAFGNVHQPILRRRSDDFIEETKNVKPGEMEVFAAVQVAEEYPGPCSGAG